VGSFACAARHETTASSQVRHCHFIREVTRRE
jgi:hypothetical protein